MTFLNAWALGFAGIAPVIVLLYLLKLKREPMTVSTLMFWQRVLQESQRRRAFFQRLRQLLSLLLHLLIFALILGALLRPTLDRFVREGASTVLILDTRARMQTTEADGQTRFARARAEALALARQASGQRQFALISANAAPTVIAPFTDDETALREALDRLTPTDATGSLDGAIHLADQLLQSRKGDRRILVFTDRELPPIADLRSPISFAPTATTRDNVAVTRLATRPLLSSPQTSEVLLEIANFGRTPARGNVELSFDGKLLEVKPYALDPGAKKTEIFPTVPRPSRNTRGWLTARLDTADALATDNIAYAVLPADPPRRVLLVSKGNWFLEKLLAADQGLAFELIGPDAYTPEMAPKFDAVVLDNFLPEGFDLAKSPGNFLFLKQTPFGDGGAPLEQPLISETETQHPAMRLVNLQNVTFLRAASLAMPKLENWKWQAPIRALDNHPLMITGEVLGTPPRRVAALALDIADSDLPLRIAFPLLISNTLHWLAGENVVAPTRLTAGETLVLAAGEAVDPRVQTSIPSASSITPGSDAKSGKMAKDFFQPMMNGFYALTTAEGPRWLAVNTFSEAESDLRGAPEAPAVAMPKLSALPLAQFTAWPLWRYLALAAFALFAAEWWLFHRRRTE
jgi:hypothetical protein